MIKMLIEQLWNVLTIQTNLSRLPAVCFQNSGVSAFRRSHCRVYFFLCVRPHKKKKYRNKQTQGRRDKFCSHTWANAPVFVFFCRPSSAVRMARVWCYPLLVYERGYTDGVDSPLPVYQVVGCGRIVLLLPMLLPMSLKNSYIWMKGAQCFVCDVMLFFALYPTELMCHTGQTDAIILLTPCYLDLINCPWVWVVVFLADLYNTMFGCRDGVGTNDSSVSIGLPTYFWVK